MLKSPIINFIYLGNIPAEKNRGIYQRLYCLSNEFKVNLFTLNNIYIDQELAKKITIIRFPYNIGRIQKYLFSLWFLFILNKNRELRSDCFIHTINHQQYLLGFLSKIFFRTKWVIDFFHSPFYRIQIINDIKHYPLIIYDKILIKIFYKILPQIDMAIVMAHSHQEGFAGLLHKIFNVDLNKIVAVPDGVDLSYVQNIIAEKAEKSCEPEEIKIIHVGSINPKKFLWGLDLLSETKKAFPQLKLIIVGDHTSEPETTKKITSWLQKNAHWIEYLGWVNHAQALQEIARADIGLCILDDSVIDYNYCHPNKIYEYMALKKAILAPDLEGIRGIIKDGENGLLYKSNDPDDFLKKLAILIKDKKLREKIAEKAKEDIEKYDWPELNKKVIKAFNNIMKINTANN